VITEVDWRGDLDGEVVLTLLGEAGASERVIDRPGDLVSTMMAEEFVDEALIDVTAVYGYCLASRGISEPIFVDQIVKKIAPFLRSARIDSLPLYQLTERIAELIRSSGKEGVELRELLLAEGHRMKAQRAADLPRG
jgi:hypothetical protein